VAGGGREWKSVAGGRRRQEALGERRRKMLKREVTGGELLVAGGKLKAEELTTGY